LSRNPLAGGLQYQVKDDTSTREDFGVIANLKEQDEV
jgi:hypothetical protein